MTLPDPVDALDEEVGWPLPDEDALADETVPPAPGADQANRMLRSLAALEAADRMDLDIYNAEIERLKAWRDRRDAIRARQKVWFQHALEGFARAEHRRTKAVTLDLPNGKLTLRKRRATIDDNGDADLGELAETAPEAVRTKREVAVTAALKILLPGNPRWDSTEDRPGLTAHDVVNPATGEIVPGLTWWVPGETADDRAFKASTEMS